MGTIELNTIATGQNTFNLNSNNLKNFMAWQGKVAGGLQGATAIRSVIAAVGDSNTMGAGWDGSAGNTAGGEPFNWLSFLAKQLTTRGLTTTRNAAFGTHGISGALSTVTAWDTRLTFNAGLSADNAVHSLGGAPYRLQNTAQPVTFTPTGNVDTAVIFSRGTAGDGTFTVSVDAGGTLATVVGNVADSVVKTVVPLGSLGAHAINCQRSSGGFCYILGIYAYDSTSSGFDVINAGAYGTESGYHAETAAWSAMNVLGSIPNLALVLINLGTNDMGNGTTPLATTLANLQAIITKAQTANADVVLIYPNYGPDGQFGSSATREALRQGMIALAYSNNCIMLDLATRFISYASSNALGIVGASVHMTAAGYNHASRFVATTCVDR